LLETVLVNYSGTLILISHDRSFINEVVTSILAYEGTGVFNEFVGGYDDYKAASKKRSKSVDPADNPANKSWGRDVAGGREPKVKLSYSETRELEKLPKDIEGLETAIAKAHAMMGQSDFYNKSTENRVQFMKKLGEDEAQLAKLYARWEQLEAKR
jgi:ATP-binding cassette subfamily F protein uup